METEQIIGGVWAILTGVWAIIGRRFLARVFVRQNYALWGVRYKELTWSVVFALTGVILIAVGALVLFGKFPG